MDWSDLGSAFQDLPGDIGLDSGGGQESRDALPPPGSIVLSQRLQRFLNTLLGPMNAAWANLATLISTDDNAGDLINNPPPAAFANFINGVSILGVPAANSDAKVQAAQDYLDYAQWVIPYLEAIQAIIDPGPIIGAYKGDALTAALQGVGASENDFTDNSSWLQFALPHLVLARQRRDAIMYHRLSAPDITYPNPAPALPPKTGVLSYFLPDIGAGDVAGSLIVIVGGALVLVYLFGRASRGK